MKQLIEKYKRLRKLNRIRKHYQGQYAFIGIGNHSINNLYPVLDYLNVSLKYIVSNSEETAKTVSEGFSNIEGTTDFEKVLNDEEVKGVFVSVNPKKHFDIVKKALQKNKHVFVEKPPCYNLDELNQLIKLEKESNGTVLAGFQKRYAPVYQKIKTYADQARFYRIHYFTGSYPEGNSVTDLFIHSLDICNYLFGEAKLLSKQKINNQGGTETYLLHLQHPNGIIGNVELSTDFWWARAKESLFVNTDKFLLESTNTQKLIRTNKPTKIGGIPLEKIKSPEIKQTILYEQNSFLPVAEHNELYSAGFYDEIKAFLDICEYKKANKNHSHLMSLINTYQLISQL